MTTTQLRSRVPEPRPAPTEREVVEKVATLLGQEPPTEEHPVFVLRSPRGNLRIHVVPFRFRHIVSIWAEAARELDPTPELFDYLARRSDDFPFGHPFIQRTHDGISVRVAHRLLDDFEPDSFHAAVSNVAKAAFALRRELLGDTRSPRPARPGTEPEGAPVPGYL